MALFKSMGKMANMAGTMFPGTIVPNTAWTSWSQFGTFMAGFASKPTAGRHKTF
jgi:hypothetical protein